MPLPSFDRSDFQPAEGWPEGSNGHPAPMTAWLAAILEDCVRNPRVITRSLEDGPYLRPLTTGLGRAAGDAAQPTTKPRRVCSAPWELAWIRR